MRSPLRVFAAVGLLATLVDVGLFLALASGQTDLDLWVADAFALGAAAVVSYLGNRWITFRADRDARWVSQPHWFAATAAGAGLVDIAVLSSLDSRWVMALGLAKALAVTASAVVRWICYRFILFKRVRRDLAERVERPPASGRYRLAVVIPAYNEGRRVAETVATITDHLDQAIGPDTHQILVVDDGSTDDTVDQARRAGAEVVRQPTNRGKGAAVKAGVLAADARSVVFTDADLAYAPELIVTIMDGVEDGWDVVVGSRRHDRSDALVRARWIRTVGGRTVNRLTHLVLLGHFRDTQCGIKGFRGDIGRSIFERTLIDGFAFDVEIFLIAEQDQLSLLEVPVSVANRAGSSVRLLGDTAALVADLFRIRRWAGAGRYRPSPSQIIAG